MLQTSIVRGSLYGSLVVALTKVRETKEWHKSTNRKIKAASKLTTLGNCQWSTDREIKYVPAA